MGKDESRKMHDKIGFVHPHKVYKPFSDVQQNWLVFENDTEVQKIVIKELKDFLTYITRDVTNEEARQDLFNCISLLLHQKQTEFR